MTERRHQVERNLRRVHGPDFGGAELRRAVTATFDSYGRYFYELFRLPTVRAAVDRRRTSSASGSNTSRPRSPTGAGAVLALPHLGNWDFAGAWLALQGYTVTVVAEPVEPPELFEWFVETRARLGMRVIPLSPSAGTEVLARGARQRGRVPALPTATSPATASRSSSSASAPRCPAARRCSRCAAARRCCPVGCYFRADGRHDDPHPRRRSPAERAGRIRDDVARVTQDLAHRFEDLIRVAPTHWHLLQPNWPSDRGSDPAAARPGVG